MSNTDNQSPCADIRSSFDAQEMSLIACLEKIAGKDENAFAMFYDATVNRVYGLALHITRTSHVAEEVVSDVYMQVWQQAYRYDATRGKVLTWLLTVSRSRALDALRRGDPAELCAEPELLISDTRSNNDDPLGLLLIVERDTALHTALKTLDPIPRQLLALAFLKGLSHQEISDHTGMPLGSVKTILRKTLGVLKQIFPNNTLSFKEKSL